MAGFKNEFSWSKSREDIFRKCARQYYYHYYGSWGGWHRHCDERTRHLYILKKLVNKHMWSGEKVHGAVKKYLMTLLQEGEDLSEETLIKQVLDEMRNDFRDSRNGKHWKATQKKGLFEHEYESDMTDESWKDVATHVEKCLHSFFQSSFLQELKKVPTDQWLKIEDMTHFFLNDVKVYISLDFALRDGDSVVIYDWKTGTSLSQDHDIQMACYGWYAWNQWNIDPKKIKLIEMNLNDMGTESHVITGINLEKVQKQIFSSIQDMQFMLDDISNNAASEDRFPLTENERHCAHCNFKKLCPSWNKESIVPASITSSK